VGIQTPTPQYPIDISGDIRDAGTLQIQTLNLANNVAISGNLVIGKSAARTGVNTDISGSVATASLFVNTYGAPTSVTTNVYTVDVSGTARVNKLYANAIYKYINTPLVIDTSYIVIDYNISDEYYVNVADAVTDNFSCIIQNSPHSGFSQHVVTITLLLDYTNNTNFTRYYCNQLIINGNTYVPNFNGGNPTAVFSYSSMTNTYVQQFSMIVVQSSIVKTFCQATKYST
jgi:hypothetical protein